MRFFSLIKEVVVRFFSNESAKRYLMSSLVTFVSAFAVAFVANFQTLNAEAFSFAALGAVILVAVRVAFKAVVEAFIKIKK